MTRIFQFPLYHIFCEMQLGLQLSLYWFHDLLIRHFVPPTYPHYHSVTPRFKSIYFHAHRTIPSPTLTPIIQYREYVTVQYLMFVLSLILLLISSLFCQKAALAIPTIALISSSLLASSVIQLPRYLKLDICSKGTLFNVINRCIPFGFAVPLIIITFVFFTLISISYALHVVLNLSIIICIFSLFSAINTASSAYLRFVIFTPPNLIPSTPSMASCIINSLYRLKSIGDITHPCLTPLSTPTSLLTSPSHLAAACCRQ